MRAIRVEVKWTVLSSAMGMFIFTRRYRNDGGGGQNRLGTLISQQPGRGTRIIQHFSLRGNSLCAANAHLDHSLANVAI